MHEELVELHYDSALLVMSVFRGGGGQKGNPLLTLLLVIKNKIDGEK